MPSSRKPIAKVACAGPACRKRFTPSRSTARYCSEPCRQRARRGTKKPAATATAPAAVAEAAEQGAPKRQPAPKRSTASADSHELVMALRKELEDAKALDTFEGQLALELARRLVTPGEGASSLADKVRAARSAALGQAKPATGGGGEPQPPAEDDDVAKARKRREAKAAAAAASEA